MTDRLQQMLAEIQSRVDPGYVSSYTCEACEDTGWVTVDDGLDENGKRIGQPTVRQCNSFIHTPAVRPAERSEETFS